MVEERPKLQRGVGGWEATSDSFGGEAGDFCLDLTNIFKAILTFAAVVVGVFVVATQSLWDNDRFLFWYIIVSLTGDVLVATVVGTTLACCGLFVGDVGLAHGAAVCAIFHSTLQAAVCYGGVCYGAWVVYTDVDLSTPKTILVYIALQLVLSVLFSIETCPVLCGVCGFVSHRIRAAARRSPLVEFQHRDHLLQYTDAVQLSEYQQAIERMENPITAGEEGRGGGQSKNAELKPLI